jgi:exosome complex component RRP41
MDITLGSTSGSLSSTAIHDLQDTTSYPHPTAPDGQAHVAHGLTEVTAQVFGPREPQIRREAIHDRANINVQVMMLPFSGGSASRRRGRGDKLSA